MWYWFMETVDEWPYAVRRERVLEREKKKRERRCNTVLLLPMKEGERERGWCHLKMG